MPEQAIERRTMPDVVLGGGDMAELVEQTRRNVEAAIQFARERQFVSEYDVTDRQGRKTGVRLWFHHPTWQLLGQSFGITAYTEGEPVEVKPGTWRAAAVAARVDTGRVVGRAIGLCSKSEPGKRNPTDHDIAAKAQTRAQRNALRSALGAIIVAAGFEIVDPDAPATTKQVGALWTLAGKLGWDEDEAHERAGVEHFRDMTRDEASETFDEWSRLLANHEADVKGSAATLQDESSTALHPHSTPTPDGEAGEERPDKRTGEDEAAVKSSPAGRKRSAAKQGSSSPPDRAAARAEPGGSSDPIQAAGPGSAPPLQDHMHDWQPAPTQAMAAKGWRVCSICRKALGPGEAG